MTIVLRRQPRLDVAEFVELIRPLPDAERWELLDGEAALTAPQSERHQTAIANLPAGLRRIAKDRGCKALPGLGLLNEDIGDYAPIPDVVVRCGPALDGGYAKDPVLVAEVLSPSTINDDRGRRIDFYRGIASLRTILIVYQDEVRVEAWRREDGAWRRSVVTGLAGSIEIPDLGSELRLAEIYDDI